MTNVALKDLKERVRSIERDNRRLRTMTTGMCVVLLAALLSGAAGRVSDQVRARNISLVDGDGIDRAVLAMSKEGSPTLVLYDSEGKRRLSLGVSLRNYRGVPEVWLADEKGEIIWNKRR